MFWSTERGRAVFHRLSTVVCVCFSDLHTLWRKFDWEGKTEGKSLIVAHCYVVIQRERVSCVSQTEYCCVTVSATCTRCGYISSNELCKACIMLEGLNKGRPRSDLDFVSFIMIIVNSPHPLFSILFFFFSFFFFFLSLHLWYLISAMLQCSDKSNHIFYKHKGVNLALEFNNKDLSHLR